MQSSASELAEVSPKSECQLTTPLQTCDHLTNFPKLAVPSAHTLQPFLVRLATPYSGRQKSKVADQFSIKFIGVERKTAAEVSFFLAAPTMTTATIYALFPNRDILTMDDLGRIEVGFAAAFLTALVVVKAFLAIVSRFGFAPFAWYRILIGSIALVWLLNR